MWGSRVAAHTPRCVGGAVKGEVVRFTHEVRDPSTTYPEVRLKRALEVKGKQVPGA
jgi:gamma-glutamylcysteine synthetase